MSERENIFRRIREALTVKAPAHGGTGLPTTDEYRRVLPFVDAAFEKQVDLFARNAAELRAEFRPVKSLEAAQAELKALCAAENWRHVAAHEGELSRPMAESIGLPVAFIEQGIAKEELGRCAVGITECDALVAQTRYGADFPSMMSFITGPSRTGDIERILVLGAHGPKQLTVFCL
ncbi:MAG: LUD domain-containing protein [Verrucomicrobia bacterium]|nr:LUD domain-containing protein [Verrucomicrobiota bacterium]